ncbi:Alpha amylase, catalytic domain [Raineyella antarctica]|uniref:Alpha amylase, catalytic domain n=1 Tax=Raineyella antarctica TaxID=1577474 RepID=A0A1G6GG04_9ACTN|nr:alpha-amylase family protein [Raineyella antarctica]SDB80938.1 Alpha amylase, catalytic domain [Raineyella antarctica]
MTVSQPAWVDYSLWWHAYPLGALGAEQTSVDTVHHRLDHLIGWLDYLLSIGCNGLLLGPVFASETHGYDTVDHFRIDPRLGDEDDFRRLLHEAHERGIRVVLDGVFNHVGRSNEIVRRAEAAGPGTPDGDWVRWSDGYVRCFEGSMNLPELDLGRPFVQDYVVGAMEHWLGLGADGWRLDAAYAPGAEAWAPITARVRADFPEAWLVGEVIHGDLPEFVQHSGMHSVTQYELWKAIWSSLNDTNFWELAHALERHAEFCRTFVPQTFVGNHDVTRIRSRLADDRHLGHAVVLLALLPGVPSIYYGDEQGYTGTKEERAGGDDQVRPQLPAAPENLSLLGAPILEMYQRLFAVRRRHPWLVRAAIEVGAVTNETILVSCSSEAGGTHHEIDVALNVDDTSRPMPSGTVIAQSGSDLLEIEAHGWAVLQR